MNTLLPEPFDPHDPFAHERQHAQERREDARPLCVGCGLEFLYGQPSAALSADECVFLNGAGPETKGVDLYKPGDLYCFWCWISYNTEPQDMQPDARA